MPYKFDVSYPADGVPNGQSLHQKQSDILRRFPQCQYNTFHVGDFGKYPYHSTIYSTDNPQEIARIASSLKFSDPRLFISFIERDGVIIYYHPIEVASLSPIDKQQYIRVMENLPQSERVLHDYLVNLYHTVPI